MKKPLAQKEFNLTPRQADVARLAAQGFSYKKIATELKLSTHTVATYLARIRIKCEAPNATELVFCLSHYRFN
jgi:DNA-binding CsgD family transcriptional regulator